MLGDISSGNQEKVLLDFAKLGTLSHATIVECDDVEAACDSLVDIVKAKLCIGDFKPCGECSNCLKIERYVHPDVMIIEPSGKSKSVKIEDIRGLREDAYIISNEGAGKFYIIKNADYMTVQAQNALIKILEEPPKNVAFVLVCESSDRLLSTVRSRAHIFKFKSRAVDAETGLLPEEIVNLSLRGKNDEVLECLSKIVLEREATKKLIESIVKCFLDYLSSKELEKQAIDDIILRLDKLKYLTSLAYKNVNMNLLICALCACL